MKNNKSKWIKMDHLPRFLVENQKCLKPPPLDLNICVITPKNAGFGFPWHLFFWTEILMASWTTLTSCASCVLGSTWTPPSAFGTKVDFSKSTWGSHMGAAMTSRIEAVTFLHILRIFGMSWGVKLTPFFRPKKGVSRLEGLVFP